MFLRIIRSSGVLSETLFGLLHKLIGVVFALDLTYRRTFRYATGIVAQVDRGCFRAWFDVSEGFTIRYSDCNGSGSRLFWHLVSLRIMTMGVGWVSHELYEYWIGDRQVTDFCRMGVGWVSDG